MYNYSVVLSCGIFGDVLSTFGKISEYVKADEL
jgi:hypothetical protein